GCAHSLLLSLTVATVADQLGEWLSPATDARRALRLGRVGVAEGDGLPHVLVFRDTEDLTDALLRVRRAEPAGSGTDPEGVGGDHEPLGETALVIRLGARRGTIQEYHDREGGTLAELRVCAGPGELAQYIRVIDDHELPRLGVLRAPGPTGNLEQLLHDLRLDGPVQEAPGLAQLLQRGDRFVGCRLRGTHLENTPASWRES